jgi:hypothetical protein
VPSIAKLPPREELHEGEFCSVALFEFPLRSNQVVPLPEYEEVLFALKSRTKLPLGNVALAFSGAKYAVVEINTRRARSAIFSLVNLNE